MIDLNFPNNNGKNFISSLRLIVALALLASAAYGDIVHSPNAISKGEIEDEPYRYTGVVLSTGTTGSAFVARFPRIIISAAHVFYQGEWEWHSGTYYPMWHDPDIPTDIGGIKLRDGFPHVEYADTVEKLIALPHAEAARDFIAFRSYLQASDGMAAHWYEDGVAALRSSGKKMITGYPSQKTNNYLMHETGPFTRRFYPEWKNCYAVLGVNTGRGNSGGPVWVKGSCGTWGVAGVLVGGRLPTLSTLVFVMDREAWDLVEQARPLLSISPEIRHHGPEPSTNNVFDVNFSSLWVAETEDEWVKIDAWYAEGDGTVSYKVLPNSTQSRRSAEITVRAGDMERKFTITQAGQVEDDCPDSTTFSSGDWVRATSTLRVRSTPDLSESSPPSVSSGAVGQIRSHSNNGVCNDGHNWWRIRWSDGSGRTGWSTESYLAATSPPSDTTTEPSVETLSASDVTDTSAVINARVASDGGSPVTQRSFDWGLTSTGSGWTDQTSQVTMGTGGEFRYTVTGLEPSTTYYFRGWARNSEGWGQGGTRSFRTRAEDEPHEPEEPEQVVTPILSPSPGHQNSAVNVQISTVTSGATIRYTLNGNEPTQNSPVYRGPVRIAETATLKARAFKSGMAPSETRSGAYTFDESHSIEGRFRYEAGNYRGPAILHISPTVPGSPFHLSGPNYRFEVPDGWSGTVTPVIEGYSVNPSSRSYSSVSESISGENYRVYDPPEETAYLTVDIEPEEAREAGAQWRLRWYKDGELRGMETDWREPGEKAALTRNADEYRVVFDEFVSEWNAPDTEVIYPVSGKNQTIVASYARKAGSVQVNIEPIEVVEAGARWRVNNGAWRDSGFVQHNVPIGEQTVEFRDVGGWSTPAPRAMTVTENEQASLSQDYAPAGDSTLPFIERISPFTGPVTGGTEVTIQGENFTEPLTLWFGDVEASSVTLINDGEIQATTPAQTALGTVAVRAEFPNGSAVLRNGYTYGHDAGINMDVVAQIGGHITAVDMQGDYAYVGKGTGLLVLDISSLSSPVEVGRLPLFGEAKRIQIRNNYAFVIYGRIEEHSGLAVVDIADPQAPILVGAQITTGIPEDLDLLGGLAYVADQEGGVQIIDVTAPWEPKLVSTFDTLSPAHSIAVGLDDDGVYGVVTTESEVLVLDVNDPHTPIELSNTDFEYVGLEHGRQYVTAIDADRSLAFMASRNAMHIVDTSDKAKPEEISRSSSFSGGGLVVRDQTVFVMQFGVGEFRVADVEDPANPRLIGRISYLDYSRPENLAVQGSVAAIAGRDELLFIDISDVYEPQVRGTWDTPIQFAKSIEVQGDHVYVGTLNDGVHIFDFTEMYQPTVMGTMSYRGDSFSIRGNHAYVPVSSGQYSGTVARIYDISEPLSPESTADLEYPNIYSTLANSILATPSGLAYVVSNIYPNYDSEFADKILSVYSVSDPSSIELRDSLNFGSDGYTDSIRLTVDTAYIGHDYRSNDINDTRIEVVDISNSQSLEWITTITVNDTLPSSAFGEFFDVKGSKLYTSAMVDSDTYGLKVVDIDDVFDPVVVGSYESTSQIRNLQVYGDLAYLAQGSTGIEVVDIREPNVPVLHASYIMGGNARAVAIQDDKYVYVANGAGGLTVLRMDDAFPPSVRITTPTATGSHTTSNETVNLGGVASDNRGVVRVEWNNNSGSAGVASGTTDWTATSIPLTPGTNTITVTAFDAAGNTAEDSLDVHFTIPNTEPPVITLNGSSPIIVEYGMPYVDPGAEAFDTIDGDITSDIEVTGLPIDTSELGVYEIRYTVEDSAGNIAEEKVRVVEVVDSTPPAITVLGDNPMVLEVGDGFVDPGAKAIDNRDGELSDQIVAEGSVDTTTPAEYAITYRVSDAVGNEGTASRVVVVRDTEPPELDIWGENPAVVEAGSSYIDAGAAASDHLEGDITGRINVQGLPVDTYTLGEHEVIYTVQDSWGNAPIPAVRTVEVADTTPPDISLRGSNPYVMRVGQDYREPGATAFDSFEGDLTDEISVSSNVDTNTPGEYTVRYEVEDSSGNAAEAERTVLVGDDVPPLVSISGADVEGDSARVYGTTLEEGDVPVGILAVYGRIDGGEWKNAFGTETWEFIVELADEGSLVEVYAEDNVGNQSAIASIEVGKDDDPSVEFSILDVDRLMGMSIGGNVLEINVVGATDDTIVYIGDKPAFVLDETDIHEGRFFVETPSQEPGAYEIRIEESTSGAAYTYSEPFQYTDNPFTADADQFPGEIRLIQDTPYAVSTAGGSMPVDEDGALMPVTWMSPEGIEVHIPVEALPEEATAVYVVLRSAANMGDLFDDFLEEGQPAVSMPDNWGPSSPFVNVHMLVEWDESGHAADLESTMDLPFELHFPITVGSDHWDELFAGTMSTGLDRQFRLILPDIPEIGLMGSVVVDGQERVLVEAEHAGAYGILGPVTYLLTYSSGSGGIIQGDTEQTVPYNGTGTPVEAVPEEGYHFAQWSDGVTENPRVDTNVTSDLTVEALFAIDSYTLTYGTDPNGAIEGESPQSVAHGGSGNSVTAVPHEGYRFVQWSDGSTENPRTDTNVTSDISVEALFVINDYALSYSAGANGSLEGETQQTIEHGSNGAAVTAIPDENYHFVQWSDGVTDNPRQDTNVTADLSVTAEFAIHEYTLTYAAGENGSLDGDVEQTVEHGASGTAVTAIPDDGYHFVQWSDGSTDNPRTDTNVTADISVTASFAVNAGSLQVILEPEEAVDAGAYWRRKDTPVWRPSGYAEDEIPVGVYEVEFRSIAGWATPDVQELTIEADETETIVATYVQNGSLEVTIEPAAAVDAGAQWRRVGTATWQDSGATETNVSADDHEVEFKDIAGWNTPGAITVLVPAGETGRGSGTYTLVSTPDPDPDPDPSPGMGCGGRKMADLLGLDAKSVPAVFEPALPATRMDENTRLAAMDAMLAIRLRGEEAIASETVWGEVSWSDGHSEDVYFVSAQDDIDGWAVFTPETPWIAGDEVTFAAGAETVSGEPVGPETFTFIVSEEATTYDVTLTAAHVHPDGVGQAWQIGPDTLFEEPVTVQIPVPTGYDLSALELGYHFVSDADVQLITAERVDGWLVPDSVHVVTDEAGDWLELAVQHGGVVQLKQRTPTNAPAGFSTSIPQGDLLVLLAMTGIIALAAAYRRRMLRN